MGHVMLLNIHHQTVASWVTTLVALFFIAGFVAGIATGTGAPWAVLVVALVILATQKLARNARRQAATVAA
ncbi:MAG: hypothetical protein CMN27_07000 [Salinisphaera sp.]|nr:hypothetical protein [Salinisphaera sp.]